MASAEAAAFGETVGTAAIDVVLRSMRVASAVSFLSFMRASIFFKKITNSFVFNSRYCKMEKFLSRAMQKGHRNGHGCPERNRPGSGSSICAVTLLRRTQRQSPRVASCIAGRITNERGPESNFTWCVLTRLNPGCDWRFRRPKGRR